AKFGVSLDEPEEFLTIGGRRCLRRCATSQQSQPANQHEFCDLGFHTELFSGVSLSLGTIIELLYFLEICRFPRSIERRTLRSVNTEVSEPAFAWNGLDPVALSPSRSLWAEK